MGKNSRERKLAKLQQAQEEKRLAEARRSERLVPFYRLTKRLVVTLTLTIVLLYIGVLINQRLPEIAQKLMRKGL